MEDSLKINATLTIDGMSCEHCVKTLTKTLQIAGIEDLKVQVGKASLSFDANVISMNSIQGLIESAGYSIAKPKKKGFVNRFIDGLIESNKKEFGSKRLGCCNLDKRRGPYKDYLN